MRATMSGSRRSSPTRAKGARVIEINPAGETFEQPPAHRLPPTLVLDATETMAVMQKEIFGPVLPVVAYDDISAVLDRINAGPRPLALYYFGTDGDEERRVIDGTTSGGVTINDCMSHVTAEGLPFGGIGDSGTGAYHGKFGFLTFSHPRAVYRQSRLPQAEFMMRPPFGDGMRGFLPPPSRNSRLPGSLHRRNSAWLPDFRSTRSR